jgi:beta-mannanase
VEGRKNREPEIGLYDPQSLLNEEKPVTVEHLFADFGNLSDGTFQSRFQDILEQGHKVIVTFEPFRIPLIGRDERVLQHITEGKYNTELDQFFNLLTSTKQQIYLRYAHEMEIPITRYPWQSRNPVDYIHSFRYFMTFKNPWPENIERVWGPAGDRGSIEWYPGNDVVDYVSIAIYGLPDKNITDPEKQESFSTIFRRKSWRVRWIGKPLFITEFGVKGPEDFQTKWLEGAAEVIRENRQIVGVNYFNMSDTPTAWGDIKPPDWSISKKSFYTFLEALKKE